jgi:DoxX-like family
MSSDLSNSGSKKLVWAGWVMSVLPALMLCNSAYYKFAQPPEIAKSIVETGWPLSVMFGLGIVELTCTILYLIPPTSVLGAILLTGYLGGATATHVRIADWGHAPIPVVLGIVIWIGVALRDGRLWSLIPLRR